MIKNIAMAWVLIGAFLLAQKPNIQGVQSKTPIANVEIKGFSSGDEGKKLLTAMGVKKGTYYNEATIAKAKATILSALSNKGNADSSVNVTTTPVGNGAVSILFDVTKGEKIKIKKLNFVGASKISKRTLEASLANQEEDVLGWLPFLYSGDLRADQLEYDAYRIKDTYMKHGYADARVSKPVLRVNREKHEAEIEYQIEEGEQYRVGDVSVADDMDELDSEKIAKNLSLKKGHIFNISKIRRDIKMLHEEVGNLGYAYPKIAPRMAKNDEENRINIEYIIQPGEKVSINDVVISGNNNTKDRVIRRYLYLAPGDAFNASDLKDSKNALGRTGFFEKVDVKSKKISEDQIDLLVNVKETATGTISAGGGWGSYEGLMVNASYSEKNAFGSGIATSIGFDLSKISTNYSVSFTNPRVWDSLYSLGFSFYKKKYEYYNFTQDQLGGSVMLGREFARHFHTSFGVGYIDNKSERNNKQIVSSDGNLTFYDRYGFFEDKYKKTSLYFNLSYDNTDDFYVPREGMIAAVNMEYASLSGDLDSTELVDYPGGYGKFTKITSKLGLYYGLQDWIDYDLIFRFKARATVIENSDGDKLPIAEKLYMGGIGSVRGYDPYSLTPLLNPNDLNSRIGGRKRASATVEASIPLSESAKMRLAFFYDYGMIGDNSFNEIHRSSAGAVVEWQSAFGPINLVFAKPLDDEPGDRTSTFEFSMGTRF